MFDITDLLAKFNTLWGLNYDLQTFLVCTFNDALEHFETSDEPFVLHGFTADETKYILDYDED